jgi:hypothetical protein
MTGLSEGFIFPVFDKWSFHFTGMTSIHDLLESQMLPTEQ